MARDAAATRERILESATAEFAEHGLAGARVDRVAAGADANKERIYANFGSKEGLFDAVLEANIGRMLDTVPFTADDLPGYAVAMFDFTITHPEMVRLALWHSLERPAVMGTLPEAASSTERKLSALAAAQAAGLVDDFLPAEQLLDLVLGFVHGGLLEPPSSPEHAALRRDALRRAVERLVTPVSRP